ncbi:MAG: hypothetical protein FWH35_08070, partial [Treponema sp.]|nr:hypothetical protein [Treponema sp.]
MGEYIPGAPVNDEARKRNQDLPGIGGVFNIVNLHVYHYAGNNPVKYVDPDGRKPLPVLMLRTPTIEVQRGQSNNSFNDTLKIFDETGKKVYSGKVHSEMSLPQTNSSDFTLPAGEYKATLSKTATLYENSLRISSDTVISPETGTKGISSSTGHLIHPNEITRETARTQRTNQGRSNGPFQTPQSLGCILFRNKENFNEMWSVLEDLGFKDGSSFRLIIKDPLFIE